MHTEFAPAKVNLCLHVTGRRLDGYHLLDSLAVFPGAGDTLTLRPAATLGLTIDGSFAQGLDTGPENLVMRAALALSQSSGASLHLTKNLPLASGIGGGSADAAAALRGLARLWQIPNAPLAAIALTLGADVPACLASRPARMRGIGDILDPVTLPSFGIALINPGIAVPTGPIFRSLADSNRPLSLPLPATGPWPDAATLARWLHDHTRNDLQAPAIILAPEIQTVLDALEATPRCLLARMSGSGATCFGLYETAAAANAAAQALSRPGWWCWAG